jgi:hypothetical protein
LQKLWRWLNCNRRTNADKCQTSLQAPLDSVHSKFDVILNMIDVIRWM